MGNNSQHPRWAVADTQWGNSALFREFCLLWEEMSLSRKPVILLNAGEGLWDGCRSEQRPYWIAVW